MFTLANNESDRREYGTGEGLTAAGRQGLGSPASAVASMGASSGASIGVQYLTTGDVNWLSVVSNTAVSAVSTYFNVKSQEAMRAEAIGIKAGKDSKDASDWLDARSSTRREFGKSPLGAQHAETEPIR